MEVIFIILAVALATLFLGLYKKDSTLILFSGIFNFLCGIYIMKNNVLQDELNNSFGLLICFLGIYLIGRTGADMITSDNKNGTNKSKNKTD